MTTDYRNDCQRLFNHENRNLDMIEFLPPVGDMTDQDYQFFADQRMDFIAGQAYPKEENILDYGECWDGSARHASQMSQLDRMIFEDCHNGSGSIQRQGMNVPMVNRLHRVEYIANLIKCNFDQAEDLIDFWKIVDPDTSIWTTFIAWTKSKGVEKALEYFESLAGELVSDDVHVNDKEMSNGDPFSNVEDHEDSDMNEDIEVFEIDGNGNFSYKGNSLQAVEKAWNKLTFADESDETDFMPHEIERIFDRYGFTPTEFGIVKHLNTDNEVIATSDARSASFVIDRGFATPDVFRYAKMNHQNDPVETVPSIHPITGQRTYKTFMERQPERFVKLIKYIDNAKLAEINDLRKKAFKKLDWMDKWQKRVFWSRTKTKQCILNIVKMGYINNLLKNLNKAEKHSLTMIRNCKSAKQAKYYWYLIYSSLNGERYMGRKGFVEYVLKPELNKTQENIEQQVA